GNARCAVREMWSVDGGPCPSLLMVIGAIRPVVPAPTWASRRNQGRRAKMVLEVTILQPTVAPVRAEWNDAQSADWWRDRIMHGWALSGPARQWGACSRRAWGDRWLACDRRSVRDLRVAGHASASARSSPPSSRRSQSRRSSPGTVPEIDFLGFP